MLSLLQELIEAFEEPSAVMNRSGEVLALNRLARLSQARPRADQVPLRRFQMTLEAAPALEAGKDFREGVYCLRTAQQIYRLAGDFEKVFGSDPSQATDAVASYLDVIHPSDRQEVMRRMESTFEGGACDSQYRVLAPDGEIRWVRTIAITIKEQANGETWFASWSCCVGRNKGSLPMTGTDPRRELAARLANMPLLRQRIGERLKHWVSGRKPGLFAVVIVNLVRFRSVNESMGHEAGDRILRDATRWLRGELGPRDVLAGLGGAEFAILLDHDESRKECFARVETLLAQIGKPFWVGGQELRLQARAGLAFPENLQTTVDSLLRDADAALEQCRRRRERIVSSSDDSFSRSSRQLVLEVDLRLAIERNEFHFVYQPVMDAHDGKVVMLEALLRWQHPRLGMISPASFLQLAEDSGLVLQLDLQGVERVRGQIHDWLPEIPELLGVPVSVNLSGRHFPRCAGLSLMQEMLDPRLLSGCRVAIELTESVFIEGTPEVVEILRRFRALGVDVWLDDFGVGYSSLQYLALFPLSGIKVPEFFVQSCLEDQNAAILRAFHQLAQGLDIGLVAEGIETAAQAACLTELGYTWLQGFYLSHPLSAAEVAALFAAQRARLPKAQSFSSGQ